MSDLKTLTIYGASDDLVEIDGYIHEEYDLDRDGTVLMFTAPHGAQLAVLVDFCPVESPMRDIGGGWVLSVHHADPDWVYPVRLGVRPDRDSDPAIHLAVPEGTTVTRGGGR